MEIKQEQNMEQAILEVAERLFLQNGFKGTSTVQIAKEVGCNQALVHYYFRTKDNLFNMIFEKKFRLFFQTVFDTTSLVNMTFTEKLTHISETHFDLLYKNPKMPFLILNDLSTRPENIRILKEKLHILPEKLFTLLNEDLQKEIIDGKVRNINLMDILITIISLNVSLFTMLPLAEGILNMSKEKLMTLMLHRKEENVKLILSYLRP